jgi:hypothetical protein
MTQLLIVLFLFVGEISLAQKVTDSTFGKPILWYTIYDPWAMFVGADGPNIILYESGKVIYWKSKEYHLANMEKEDVEEIISQLNLNDTFFLTSKFIQATYSTDQPSYVLRINLDTVKYFSVYGSINSKEDRKNIPKQLINIYEFVSNFEDDNSTAWLPPKIELMLSDYSHSIEEPIKWPKDWPNLSSPETITRQGVVTSIYLDKKYFSQLIKLLKSRKEKQAIEISRKKFYVGYRFPIPNLY